MSREQWSLSAVWTAEKYAYFLLPALNAILSFAYLIAAKKTPHAVPRQQTRKCQRKPKFTVKLSILVTHSWSKQIK
jgi:hypothetical protein